MPTYRFARRSPLPAFAAGVSLLVLSTLVAATPAYAADEATVDGVTYELIDATDPSLGASATDYDESANPEHPHLALASEVEINGQTVTVVEVGHNAFRYSGIASVTVPGSVVSVGPYAFAYNADLASVDLSEGLELIGTGAFRGGALVEVDLPSSLSQINPQAFFDNALTDIVIPPLVETLTIGVFGRNALTHLDVPTHVTKIRERAFAENDLTLVSLPETLIEMGEGVFTGNPDLGTVVFFGPEPALVNQGTTTPGDGNPIAIDTETKPTIRFPWRHGEDQATSGGFTMPQWWGFDSLPVATVTFLTWDSYVHATRFVLLDQTGAAEPWGTIPEWNMPADPVRDGHEFTFWHNLGAVWSPGDPVVGDLVLSSNWVDLTWVQSIILTATPEEAKVGESVTLTAEGFNANGDSLGDITDEIVFNDPNDDRILFDGNRVTFSEEGTYTITGHHSVTERPVSIVIDARPASTTLPVDEDGDVPVPDDEPAAGEDIEAPSTDGAGSQMLPATGGEFSAWTGVVGALLLAVGAGLLIVHRRNTIANGSTP